MSILTLNAGSSTLKFSVFDEHARERVAHGQVDWTQEPSRAELEVSAGASFRRRVPLETPHYGAAVTRALEVLGEVEAGSAALREPVRAVGHRIVHGGTRFRSSVRLDHDVERELGELDDLAPLHNPHALQAVAASREALPDATHVAVFDTALFADLPLAAIVYPLPWAWYADHGIRRFGFHGISHSWCAERALELLDAGERARLIVCHLGSGASATALVGRTPVATTMGFTPMEGLVMGSRSGSVDPGILTYAQRRMGFGVGELEEILNTGSGLLGISGVSPDYRAVEAAAAGGDERAELALEVHARVLRAAIGALATTLGGVDGLVFTAGIGENSAGARARACVGLECLGLILDPARNASAEPDAELSIEDGRASGGRRGRIFAVRSREDRVIARETRAAWKR